MSPIISSGPPHPNMPFRYGCACGAIWNASSPLKGTETLCGPTCSPKLFPLDGNSRSRSVPQGETP